MSDRAELTADEEISVRHLTHYLGHYDKYLIVPETLNINRAGFHLARFGSQYFGSVEANTRLMLSRDFYERFQDYEYILIYHLDSLVFSDQLEAWCDTGLDYIGPPWVPTEDTPWVKEPGVGNGGFCLRKVSSCLNVLYSEQYALPPNEYWQRVQRKRPSPWFWFYWPNKIWKHVRRYNDVQWEVGRYKRHEDQFWGNRAQHYYPDFKIADVEQALQFAFEGEPRTSFEKLGCQLPFGCHAWPKYDREFWEPHLLSSFEYQEIQ
jgi:hypothetical protein